MKTRKTDFAIIPLSEIAPLLMLEGKAAAMRTPSPGRILSVTYDHSLSRTREMLFSAEGHRVASVLSTVAAVQLCEQKAFDLIVIGHSIPLDERKSLLTEIRQRCGTPVLA